MALTRLAQVVERLHAGRLLRSQSGQQGALDQHAVRRQARSGVARSRSIIRTITRGCFSIRATMPTTCRRNISKSLARLPERQRKRFFEGVYIDDLDGALFSYEMIARARVDGACAVRAAAAWWWRSIRPGASSREDDARRRDRHHGRGAAAMTATPMCSPTARCAMRRRCGAAPRSHAYHEFEADRIVAEENFGGEMVRFVIRAADANAPVEVISASRGKVLRAEPVSALYEQGLVHHVGRFARAGRSALRLHHRGLSRRGQSRPRRRAGVRHHRAVAQGERGDPRVLSRRRAREARRRPQTARIRTRRRSPVGLRCRSVDVHGVRSSTWSASTPRAVQQMMPTPDRRRLHGSSASNMTYVNRAREADLDGREALIRALARDELRMRSVNLVSNMPVPSAIRTACDGPLFAGRTDASPS